MAVTEMILTLIAHADPTGWDAVGQWFANNMRLTLLVIIVLAIIIRG